MACRAVTRTCDKSLGRVLSVENRGMPQIGKRWDMSWPKGKPESIAVGSRGATSLLSSQWHGGESESRPILTFPPHKHRWTQYHRQSARSVWGPRRVMGKCARRPVVRDINDPKRRPRIQRQDKWPELRTRAVAGVLPPLQREPVRQEDRYAMKHVCVMLGLFMALSLAAVNASPVYDDGSKIDCCIRGCTWKASEPECIKTTRSECARMRGEVVGDCSLCEPNRMYDER